jgi:hypothetical protein
MSIGKIETVYAAWSCAGSRLARCCVTSHPYASLDDLIRPRQQRRRDREAEGFGGLEVDDQLKLRGLLDWQIAWLCTPEDFGHEPTRNPEKFHLTCAVGHQTAGSDLVWRLQHGGQPILNGEPSDTCPFDPECRTSQLHDGLEPGFPDALECCL